MDKREQAIRDVAMIARNAIDKIIEMERRPWVGLTLEELESIGKVYEENDGKIRAWANFADHIEQELKEKNGG